MLIIVCGLPVLKVSIGISTQRHSSANVNYLLLTCVKSNFLLVLVYKRSSVLTSKFMKKY